MLPLPIFAKSHRREFTFTPLHEDNPYCPVKLGFLLLARRGVFNINPVDAWRKKEFTFKEEAKQWPLFCEADCSTKTLTVSDMYSSVIPVRGKVLLLRATSP